jgi:competence protein ComEA
MFRFTKYLLLLMIAMLAFAAAPQKKGAPPSKTAATAPAFRQLDLNKASIDELKALPGIGDAYSAKIVAGRPYDRKDQLVSRKIIPQATYDKIKDMVIARQDSGKKKTK